MVYISHYKFDRQGLTCSIHPTTILKVRDNPVGDFKSMFRCTSKGSWTLSDQDNGLPVSDSLSENLKVKQKFMCQQLNQIENL